MPKPHVFLMYSSHMELKLEQILAQRPQKVNDMIAVFTYTYGCIKIYLW
jgi:hypothetical protein